MADFPTSVFFGGGSIYGVGAITFDLLLAEDHNFNSQISEHPIEDGSIISDHILNELENGTLTGFVSNYSLYSTGLTSNRPQDIFDALVDLWKSKELVTVTLIHNTYENCLINSMPISRDSDTGDAIVIQISFKKVNIVKLQTLSVEAEISVNDLADSTSQQVAESSNNGRVQGVDSSIGAVP